MRVLRTLLTLAVTLSFVLGSVTPASALISGQVVVSQNNADLDQWSVGAKNPVNNTLVQAWINNVGSGDNHSLLVSASTDGGATWSSEIKIFGAPSGAYMSGLRMVYDKQGGLHVVFWSGLNTGRQVRYMYVTPGNNPAVPESWVLYGSLCDQSPCLDPSLSTDSQGYVYVSYEVALDSAKRMGIRRRLLTSGDWSAAQSVPTSGKRGSGDVEVTPDGKVHVTYYTKSTANPPKAGERYAYYERYASFDNFVQETKETLSASRAVGYPPAMTQDDAGNVHILWADSGEVRYQKRVGGGAGDPIEVAGIYDGDPNVDVAVTAAGKVYATWLKNNFKEVWQNTRPTSGAWGSAVNLSGDYSSQTGNAARYQSYYDAADGEIAMAYAERTASSNAQISRFVMIEKAIPDTIAPTVSAVTLTAPTSGQRASGKVSGTDTADGGATPSGIAKLEYSLDNTLWVSVTEPALPSPPAAAITDFTFPVDLANPGAGGTWGSTSHILYVRLTDGKGNIGPTVASSPPLAYVVATPVPTNDRFLAEGYTGGTFDEYLTLANPGATVAEVAITYQYAGTSSGAAGTMAIVQPGQRVTVNVDQTAGQGKELSVKLQSPSEFVVERPMYFSNYPAAAGSMAYNRIGVSALSGITGGHVGQAAFAPRTTWYFAEGYTGSGFEGYFTIQNPGGTDSVVAITYYLDNGSTVPKSVTVPAASRKTVVIHNPSDSGGIGTGAAFSAKLVGSQPIIVERVMYFNYTGSMGSVTGGSAILGANSTATNWYFAEGYTGSGFDEYLTIQNPNGTAGTADITYYVEGQATPTTCQVPLQASSRTTVLVHNDPDGGNPCGLGRGKAHSTKVTTTDLAGIIVERPMYFLYSGAGLYQVDGGHNVMGATSLIAPNATVVMAEGYTGSGFEQYLTFQNPQTSTVTVHITYMLSDGSSVPKTVTLPANQRLTVSVHLTTDPYGLGTGKEFATKVHVDAAAAGGVLVERVNYFRYAGSATGGFSAFGVPYPGGI